MRRGAASEREVALPVAVAVLWGLFLAPKARLPMPPAPTVVARMLLLFGGAVAAWLVGFWWLAVVGTALAGDTTGVAKGGR